MQLLKHIANAMQRAEGFVLERALVDTSSYLVTYCMASNFRGELLIFFTPAVRMCKG